MSAVSQWKDIVSGSANADQAIPDWQPTRESNQLNGHPIIRFNKSNVVNNFAQHMRIPNANCPAAFAGIGTGEFTTFAVIKPTSFATVMFMLSKDVSNNNTQIPTMVISVTTGQLAIHTGANTIPSGLTQVVAGAWNRIGIARSESLSVMRYFLNGVFTEQKVLFSGGADNTRPAYMGARDDGNLLGEPGGVGINADVAEMIFFNKCFNAHEANVLDGYFAARYGF